MPPSIFVDVLGDSLAELLADGLRTQLEDRPDIAVVSHTKSSSGFVRDDFYDWTQAVTDLLASGDKIDAVVMMIGANDRQLLRDGDQSYELRSDEWKATYVRRIDGILALLKARNIKIFWVGLPPMKSDRLTADVVWFNEIYRDRTEAAGGIYLDIWDGFVDADGAYAATGPDINGQVAKLRAGDGVHFSKAGALLAAHYPERELRRAFGDAPMAAAPTMTSPLATPESGSPQPGGDASAALQPGAPGEEQPEPEKPEYGPVMPLDAVETSPGAPSSAPASPPDRARSPRPRPRRRRSGPRRPRIRRRRRSWCGASRSPQRKAGPMIFAGLAPRPPQPRSRRRAALSPSRRCPEGALSAAASSRPSAPRRWRGPPAGLRGWPRRPATGRGACRPPRRPCPARSGSSSSSAWTLPRAVEGDAGLVDQARP